jgi:hypothetical protein
MARPESLYAAGFIEGSLGLPSGWLSPDRVPRDLVDELASVLRGSPPADRGSPSLEAKLMAFGRELERSALEERGFFVRKARWPGAARLAVCLTHDVDNIERPREHIERVKERFSRSEYRLWEQGELSLYDNIGLIAEREAERGFRSSFYLMSAEYPLSKVRSSARALVRGGWEVGLHGDFGTHDSQSRMDEAVRRLESGIGVRARGVREHYLRFDFSRSWQVMERAGFDYDTTLGTADTLGFKLGLATPFHPPDEGWRPMRLVELPLSLMDTTLWGYLKRSEGEGLRDIAASMKAVEEVEGLFTLLWHQEAVRMRGGRVYWKVLSNLARRKGVFVSSGAGVTKWWRAREAPLEVGEGGRLITLGGKPPDGLTLILKTAEGTGAKVTAGATRRQSGSLLIAPAGAGFRVEVSGAGR